MEKRLLDSLPEEVKAEAKDILRAYDQVTIYFEYGTFHVSTGNCIKKVYGNDYEVIGQIKANDVYSEIERMENYINVFADYPAQYRGKRDYKMLNKFVQPKVDFDTMTITTEQGIINEDGDFMLTYVTVRKM